MVVSRRKPLDAPPTPARAIAGGGVMADDVRLGELYREQQATEYYCQEATCVFPLDGNCECLKVALAAFLAERVPSALSQFLKPKFL